MYREEDWDYLQNLDNESDHGEIEVNNVNHSLDVMSISDYKLIKRIVLGHDTGWIKPDVSHFKWFIVIESESIGVITISKNKDDFYFVHDNDNSYRCDTVIGLEQLFDDVIFFKFEKRNQIQYEIAYGKDVINNFMSSINAKNNIALSKLKKIIEIIEKD